MPSSSGHRDFGARSTPRQRAARGLPVAVLVAGVAGVAGTWASRAEAQQPKQAQGFAVERLYPSAPGGGWMVMDDLDIRGGLGGAIAISGGYAHDPLRVKTLDGSQHLAVVSKQAFANIGIAVTYDRYRLYLDLPSPLVVDGQGGTIGDYSFVAPSADLGKNPDSVSDVRLGLDARFIGVANGPFRLGAGAQLFIPPGSRTDYVTDGTYRGMGRVLFAGDVGSFAYAAQLGIHVRPVDDSPTPGSPEGSELLFGVAGGPKLPVGDSGKTVVVVGPEIFGETAFRSFLGATTTGLEALLTGRLEGTGDADAQLRVKLGAGAGISPHFGAPEWRIVLGLEVFDHNTDRDPVPRR